MMLDSLILHIPLYTEFYTTNGNLHTIKGDIADFQVPAKPSYFKRDPDTKEETIGDLFSPFERIPTSFASMAMKFYAVNVANTPPYVAINASAKLLQGHNVYGGESVLNLASEMLALLKSNFPFFYDTLDIQNARISRIDSTFSVRLTSERLVQPALRFLKNADTGQRKADNRRDFHNTVYFGLATSPYGGAKIYGKHYELKENIKKLEQSASRGNTQSVKMLEVFNSQLLDYAKGLLRFECSTKARQLEKCNLPKNLWAFIDYQLHTDKSVLTKLWRMWFDPILSTLKGDIMPDIDDSDIYEKCCKRLWTQGSNRALSKLIKKDLRTLLPADNYTIFNNPHFVLFGRISYTRANNAYNFYKLLKSDGYEDVKNRYVRRTFNENVKYLVDDVNISRAVLKNLTNEVLPTVPVQEIVTLDFKGQYPSDYKPVISQHLKDYTKYIQGASIGSRMFPNLVGLNGELLPQADDRKVKYKFNSKRV
jgi:II/X family phage/plasmid replication protein